MALLFAGHHPLLGDSLSKNIIQAQLDLYLYIVYITTTFLWGGAFFVCCSKEE